APGRQTHRTTAAEARLRRATKMRREAAQTRRKLFARTRAPVSWPSRFLIFQGRQPLEHLLGRDHPIHRNGVTTFGWANQTQRSSAACAADNDDIVTFNDPSAGEAVTFVFEPIPFPVAVEPLQK